MNTVPIPSHPVLDLDEARALEARLFGGEEGKEWRAMRRAGCSIADAVLADFAEAGGFPSCGRLVVAAGKGNNAGDALIAAREILERFPYSSGDVLFAFGPRKLKGLAARAWRGLSESCPGRVRMVRSGDLSTHYDLSIDGIFGYQYRPPLPEEAVAALAAVNRCDVRFRASVDLPSGLDEPGAYRADFTYATGSVKAPLLGCKNAGRPRYLDLDFFRSAPPIGDGQRVVLRSVLGPLAGLRTAWADKRSQGHLALVGGSGGYPGAVLMAALAALQSGVGLVTAFVPERLAALFAARAPGAMWVGMPETSGGGLAFAGLPRVLKGAERATAFAVGPGLGRDSESISLVAEIVKTARVPLVIDADALQPDLVGLGTAQRILTPHAGEFARISNGADLRALCNALPAVIVAKGPVTRVCGGGTMYHSLFGGPVLARGGSGDLLAGLTGGLLAQSPSDALVAACRAVVWHGLAADLLAQSQGQTAVQILQWLDFLAPALRESVPCPAT